MLKSNAKKLTIAHTESSCGWGGQEIRILTEAAGMIQRGHRVTLLCPPEATIFAAAKMRGVPVVSLPIGRKSMQGLRSMRRWLAANATDVINTHSSTDSWLAAVASRLIKAPPPIVRTRHISAPIPNNISTRWLYQSATRHIVTTGMRLRQQLIDDNHYRADTITSVPTGVDVNLVTRGNKMQARDQLDLDNTSFLIGIVATLRSWKGHQYLIDAFAKLNYPSAKLVIVGDGPQYSALAAKINKSHLEARVLMVGNQSDVRPWLTALDIFALPSYANEGVPQSIIQAMLCGLPIITTPIGSILEAVEHDRSGLIVVPEDVDSLAAAMQRLIADPDLRQRLGDHAYQHAYATFGLEQMLDKMETVFARACST